MAQDIQVGRYSLLLHKLLEMVEGAPVPVLAPELLATMALEVDRPEWGFLKQEHLAGGQATRTPGAGEKAQVTLTNTSATGIVVVTLITIRGPSAAAFSAELRQAQTAGGSAGTTMYRDQRISTVVDLTMASLQHNTVAAATGIILQRLRMPADTTVRIPGAWVLGQGHNIGAVAASINEQITVGFEWYERAVERSELQG